MSEKMKIWNSNLYPHLVKTMDNHYSAIGIASEAQIYLDRGVKSNDTTSHDTVYFTQKPQRSNQRNAPLRPSRQPNPQQTGLTNPPEHGHHPTRRKHQHTPRISVCKNYLRGRPCHHGRTCIYRHPPRTRAQAHIAATNDNIQPINDVEQDFRFGQDEM